MKPFSTLLKLEGNHMTEAERSLEFHVTYQTRLGILCGEANPTDAQHKMAWDEAAEHMRELDNQTDQPQLL